MKYLLLVFVFLLIFIFTIKLNIFPSEKLVYTGCTSDSECSLTEEHCCSSCGGGITPINKTYQWFFENTKKIKCKNLQKTCILPNCIFPLGGAFEKKSKCQNSKCVLNYSLNCKGYCLQLKYKSYDPYKNDNEFVSALAQALKIKESEITSKCVCNE